MKETYLKLLDDIKKYKTVDNVVLVAVSKTQAITKIRELNELGINIFGENKAQELKDKYDQNKVDCQWHYIGRLQSNKIKYVCPRVSIIQSVATIELLEEINNYCAKYNLIMECLLQVNPLNEATKQGFNALEVDSIMTNCKVYKNIKIQGLMCMAPFDDVDDIVNRTFKAAKNIYDLYDFKYLSMGMSQDYIKALQNGSNMLRIGSMLFEK